MKSLVKACRSFDPIGEEEDFSILLLRSARDVELFRIVISKTNFALVSDEKKAEYLAGIINQANRRSPAEPSPQREAARILIDEVGFNPNNKSAPGASNALSAAAEQMDVETTKMVLNCRNRIRGFEDDTLRDLIIFGIDRGLINVRRDLATPRGGEDVIPKLLRDEVRMNELRRLRAESTTPALGGGGSGGGRSNYLELGATPQIPPRDARVSPEGGAPATATPPGERVRVSPEGIVPAAQTNKNCCVIS